MKTNEQLEGEIAELREQMYITRSAQLSLVEAIAMALHLPGTLDKTSLPRRSKLSPLSQNVVPARMIRLRAACSTFWTVQRSGFACSTLNI